MVILKRSNIFISAILISIASVANFFKYPSASATDYCVSQKCKDAQAAEAAAKQKSADASATAQSYEEEVARLNHEITVIQSEINSLEARAEDLSSKIQENESKLQKQQSALAKLIVEMHFETDIDPILVLAGSSSISDLAEKEARNETVEEQVTASAKEIKITKAELEKEKTSVDLLLSDAESKRSEIASARARQQSIADKYKNDASSYLADAEEARKTKEAEIDAYRQEMLSKLGRNTVVVDPGLDSYAPALRSATGFSCPSDNWRYYGSNGHHGYYSWHGGYICECVGYVGYKVFEYWGKNVGWGDAKYWGSGAASAGYTVDNNPTPHSIGYYTSGPWGHVVWIESVNGNTVDYSEYNGNVTANFSYVKGANPSKFRYIHFDY